MAQRPRVAIIGASGIGKHHANWWNLEGAEVCAFAGTSAESVRETAAMLEQTFGLRPTPYTTVAAMLRAEKPEFLDVCSPPPLHEAHVRAGLEAGAHVLCEKPFVYDPQRSREELLGQARGLLALARAKGLTLGVCTQYSAGAPVLRDLWHKHNGDDVVRSFTGHLESPAKGRAADPARVWVDLAPHPISVLQELAPGGELDWNSLETHFDAYEAIARFTVRSGAGHTVACEIITRNATEPPLNTRRFVLNGYAFTIEGERGDDGVYRAKVIAPDGAYVSDDFMRLLIREFRVGRPVVTGDVALAGLDWLTGILSRSRPGAGES